MWGSTFVGSLLQLLVVSSLLRELKDGDSELRVGEGEGLGVNFIGHGVVCVF